MRIFLRLGGCLLLFMIDGDFYTAFVLYTILFGWDYMWILSCPSLIVGFLSSGHSFSTCRLLLDVLGISNIWGSATITLSHPLDCRVICSLYVLGDTYDALYIVCYQLVNSPHSFLMLFVFYHNINKW